MGKYHRRQKQHYKLELYLQINGKYVLLRQNYFNGFKQTDIKSVM